MCAKEWKRIAEREARRYREHRAFVKGVRDAGSPGTERSRASERWILAVDYVLEYLHRTDPEKERFMRIYLNLDGSRRTNPGNMVALSFTCGTSTSTVYAWRSELLSLLVIAATQTRAIVPYESKPTR